jgi:hypothetical protein
MHKEKFTIENLEKEIRCIFILPNEVASEKGKEEITMVTFRDHYNEGICPWRVKKKISRKSENEKDRVLDTETVIFHSMNAGICKNMQLCGKGIV